MSRQEKLVHLYEGLRALDVFDRINRGLPGYSNRAEKESSASRDTRRAEILAEIARLEAAEPWFALKRWLRVLNRLIPCFRSSL